MNERIAPTRRTGNTSQALRTWGLIFLAAGIFGRAIIEIKLLGMTTLSYEQLLQVLEGTENSMIYATVAIVLQVMMTCAVPLFAFLLVEGVQHTTSFRNYVLRVAGLALVTEIPYDLATSGVVFNWNDQNPVLGVLVCMVMIYLFKYYSGRKAKNILIDVLVVLIATMWVDMLQISEGVPLVLIVTALWFTRNKRSRQVFVGAVVACLCVALPSQSGVDYMRYLASPMMFLMIHRYNGEPGEGNQIVNYAAYPALLLVMWLIGIIVF